MILIWHRMNHSVETPPGPSSNSPSLLFEYQCRSGQIYQIGESNRMESKLSCPNWNALPTNTAHNVWVLGPLVAGNQLCRGNTASPRKCLARGNKFFGNYCVKWRPNWRFGPRRKLTDGPAIFNLACPLCDLQTHYYSSQYRLLETLTRTLRQD